MKEDWFECQLLESAEAMDRSLSPQRIAMLKKGYQFFRDAGMSDEAIKSSMALTAHEIRLIKH
jgi:hypothetical protein